MAETRTPLSPGLRMLIDFGPLAVFFVVNSYAPGLQIQRIVAATAAFMIAMVAAMLLSWWKAKHISPMLWITAALVLPFGGLTIYFHDQTFIQIKPTIVYTMFAVILGYGLIAKKPLLQLLLETAYPGLSAKGWRLLTINWTGFFLAMAVLNEVMRNVLSWDQWVTFKTWTVIPLTLVFAMLNIPMLLKHGLQLDKPEDTPLPPEG
ncbi:septation protein IspZ [Sphingomonas psychrotolerans]|uniref:Inner membrane-spanning protein YciB n=1 Tax=Sphingomonas psychrotolerans TaxID=1327635 RepID=A0A2K8MCY7_9SPHN|nr:septation protein IspZ [Sphingomonas psychrotolerans]ATY31760.1 septation protein IspZ [Sphingomonas psychrotolerans]